MSTRRRAEVTAPADAHEWVSFEDPDEERTWVFDSTFLLSSWTCIFGRGCQGVLTGPAPELQQGCCSYGAHFTGPEDAARVRAAAATLTDEQWQHRNRRRGGIIRTDAEGTQTTRLVDGACIFLNRPGFPGGPGCALHRAALDAGRLPLETKPDVCWQLPLRREDAVAADGHVTSTITQWDRRHWGDGGLEFHWWCTESPDAFVGSRPVYLELGGELVAMAGPVVYGMLATYLESRRTTTVPLPHRQSARGRRNPGRPQRSAASSPVGLALGLLLVLVLGGQAPRRVLVTGLGAALCAGFDDLLG